MLLELLEWIGTFGILLGMFYLNCKKASSPKTRIKGQIILIINNLYGYYNCIKEIKKGV